MSRHTPRLPEKPVKLVLVSREYPEQAESLKRRGITPIKTLFDSRLPTPTAYHPDMQVCLLEKEIYVLRQSPLRDRLISWNLTIRETRLQPRKEYPGDVLCNGFVWNGWLVGNPRTLDSHIQQASVRQDLQMLAVRQGYASCSVALIDEKAAVTADEGMARQLEKHDFTVLRIRPGFIVLPGYDTGFIGGCCGKLAPDILAVSGRLDSHPDGGIIRKFVKSRGVNILELTQNALTDVGGILPLA